MCKSIVCLMVITWLVMIAIEFFDIQRSKDKPNYLDKINLTTVVAFNGLLTILLGVALMRVHSRIEAVLPSTTDMMSSEYSVVYSQ